MTEFAVDRSTIKVAGMNGLFCNLKGEFTNFNQLLWRFV